LALGVLILTMANGQGAECDEWYLQPTLRTQAVANDNATLNRHNKQEVIGAILSPQLQLGHRSDVLDLNLTGGADFNGYAINSQLSSIDEHVAFLGAYKASELSTLSLGASFIRDTIVSNPEDNSGQVSNNVFVNALSASPSWSYQFSELDRLSISAGYLKKTFDGGGGSDDRTDYSAYSASTSWLHQLTERDTVSARLSYGRFEPEGSQNNSSNSISSNSISSQVGWTHDFSELLRLQMAGGPRWTLSEGNSSGSGNNATPGYNASASLAYQPSELSKVQVSFSRQDEPSSTGETRVRDRVGLMLSYQLEEFTTFTINGGYVENESCGGSSSGSNNNNFCRYFSIEPSVTWLLQEDLDLALSYRYQEETFDNPSGQAMSNAVFLSLTYRAPRWSWSD
jgi:hypothetical protein